MILVILVIGILMVTLGIVLSCVQENTYHFSNRMNLVFNRYVPYIKNIVYTI